MKSESYKTDELLFAVSALQDDRINLVRVEAGNPRVERKIFSLEPREIVYELRRKYETNQLRVDPKRLSEKILELRLSPYISR